MVTQRQIQEEAVKLYENATGGKLEPWEFELLDPAEFEKWCGVARAARRMHDLDSHPSDPLKSEEVLAIKLHEKLCRLNHTDGCSWFYEQTWDGGRHQRYLEKAKNILNIVDIESALEVVAQL